MNRMPHISGFHAEPSQPLVVICAIPIFLLCALLYSWGSDYRKESNAEDKFLPSVTEMYTAIKVVATEPESRRRETPLLISDTLASLQRIGIAMFMTVIVSTFIGLNMGLYRGVDIFLNPFLKVVASIPPVALIPALLICFGKDELGKVMMVFLGLVFSFIMSIRQRVQEIPINLIIKAETLNASSIGTTYRIILPQIWPYIIDLLRNNIGYVWVFLIVAEQLGSQHGLGYRIFLMKRFQGWAVIYPYVMWITLLSFLFVGLLYLYNKVFHPWYQGTK